MIKELVKKNLLINISIIIIFCVACDSNSYEETNMTQKEMVIIGENDENKTSEENTKNITNGKYNEGEVLVIIKKGYDDISKNELLKNAKIIFTFSDDDEKEAILLVQNKNYTIEELIEKLKHLPEVISVEPNYNLNKAHIN